MKNRRKKLYNARIRLTNNKVFMEDWKKKLINKSQRKSKPFFFMNYERGKK